MKKLEFISKYSIQSKLDLNENLWKENVKNLKIWWEKNNKNLSNFLNNNNNSKYLPPNKKRKLTSEHKELISKYSTFEGKNIWSPAKISQICLTHIDSEDYYNKVILSLEKDYEEQCKLL